MSEVLEVHHRCGMPAAGVRVVLWAGSGVGRRHRRRLIDLVHRCSVVGFALDRPSRSMVTLASSYVKFV